MDYFKNLSTGSLVKYYKVCNEMLAKWATFSVANNSPASAEFLENGERFKQLQKTIEQLEETFNERSKMLKWSIEEIYRQCGQYDAYIVCEFYPGSATYKKYGPEVHGIVLYQRQERARLENLIQSEQFSRNDGPVFIDSGYSDPQVQQVLKSEGFLASDVREILSTGKYVKTYNQIGEKEIPNTQTIRFNPKNFNVSTAQISVLGHYLKDGYSLPDHDLLVYYINI